MHAKIYALQKVYLLNKISVVITEILDILNMLSIKDIY